MYCEYRQKSMMTQTKYQKLSGKDIPEKKTEKKTTLNRRTIKEK